MTQRIAQLQQDLSACEQEDALLRQGIEGVEARIRSLQVDIEAINNKISVYQQEHDEYIARVNAID